MSRILIAIIFLIPNLSQAAVNAVWGSYSDTWIDIALNNRSFFFIKRTYNSNSAKLGIFGKSFCSNLETNLKVISSRKVQIQMCGQGETLIFTQKRKGSIYEANNFFQGHVKKNKNKWVYQYLNGDKIVFNQLGKPIEIVGQTRNILTYQKGRLVGVRAGSKKNLLFKYNNRGLVKSIHFNGKQKAKYTYQGHFLRTSENSWGNISEYSYGQYGLLSEVVYQDRKKETVEYDRGGRVIKVVDRTLCTEKFDYKLQKQQRKVFSKKLCKGVPVQERLVDTRFDKKGRIVSQKTSENGLFEINTYRSGKSFPVAVNSKNTKQVNKLSKSGRLRFRKTVKGDRKEFVQVVEKKRKIAVDRAVWKKGKISKRDFIDAKLDRKGNLRKLAKSNEGEVSIRKDEQGRVIGLSSEKWPNLTLSYKGESILIRTIEMNGTGQITFKYNAKDEVVEVTGKDPTITSDILETLRKYESFLGKEIQ